MTDAQAIIRRAPSRRSAIATQLDVIHALVLHDIKSRFFGNGIGYIVTILWPTIHLGGVMLVFVLTGRPVPFGQSKLLYISTGVYPYIVWNYISRFTMLGVVMNRGYLQYPIIKLLDIIFARIFLELNTSFIIFLWLIVLLYLMGEPIMPHDPARAALGVAGAIAIGVGFGVLGGVLTSIFPLFQIIYVGLLILGWITSGILINPELFPAVIGDLFAWNPLLHCIEMVRAAYYVDYPTRLMDIRYSFEAGFGSLTIGLGLERLLRRYTL